MDVDLDLLVTDPLDVDARDRTALELVLKVGADLVILEYVCGVLLVAVPARLPIGDDPEPQTVWMDFLPHQATSSVSATTIVI